MEMRRLRYNCAISLDGFIASPDGSTNWIVEDPSIDFDTLYAEFSTFVMGRKTYETMLAYGDRNPLKSKSREEMVIASRSLDPEKHQDVTVVREEAIEYVEQLKQNENGKDIWLFGGGELATLLLEARLVDIVEVAIMPVMIGEGVKMVGVGVHAHWQLRLLGLEKLESGILMCTYGVVYI